MKLKEALNEIDPGTFDGPANSFSSDPSPRGGMSKQQAIKWYRTLPDNEKETAKKVMLASGVIKNPQELL